MQTIPDKQLAAVGAKRTSCIRVPYFGVALQCLPGTELVLTVTSGMQSVVEANEIIDAVSQDVMSNYNAPDNRCYVEIRGSDRNGSGQLVRGDNLYDGQTREQLAFVLSPCASGKPCGDLFSKDAPAHEKLATTDEESYSRHFNTSPERCNEARNPFPHEPQTHNEVGDSAKVERIINNAEKRSSWKRRADSLPVSGALSIPISRKVFEQKTRSTGASLILIPGCVLIEIHGYFNIPRTIFYPDSICCSYAVTKPPWLSAFPSS